MAITFMTCDDRLPTPLRRRVWRDEQRLVIGKCLRGVFVPEPDESTAKILALLGRVESKTTSS